jgi:pyruvate, water dikinase
MTAVPLDEALDEALFGGKRAQLAVGLRASLPVPNGVALSVPLVEAISRDETAAATTLDHAVHQLRPPLAVRSSAVGEDSGAGELRRTAPHPPQPAHDNAGSGGGRCDPTLRA